MRRLLTVSIKALAEYNREKAKRDLSVPWLVNYFTSPSNTSKDVNKTAYMLFSMEEGKIHDSSKATFAREVGDKWRSMSDAEKEKYIKKAKKVIHIKEMKAEQERRNLEWNTLFKPRL